MKTIWKYELQIIDRQEIDMPVGAEVLHVAEQNGVLCMWAVVEPDNVKAPSTILIRGTGHYFTGDEGHHLGSVVTAGGALVWHVFDA